MTAIASGLSAACAARIAGNGVNSPFHRSVADICLLGTLIREAWVYARAWVVGQTPSKDMLYGAASVLRRDAYFQTGWNVVGRNLAGKARLRRAVLGAFQQRR